MAGTRMPQVNLPESICLALNPFPIVIRSRKQCGLSGDGFVAALTNHFSQVSPSVDPSALTARIQFFFGCQDGDGSIALMNSSSIVPVTENEWTKLREVLSQDITRSGRSELSSLSSMSYEDMMLGGFRCLLDNRDKFESTSFPIMFPYGTGSYCICRRTPLFFRDYYTHLTRLSRFDSSLHAPWLVWCKLIDEAAHICERRVREGTLEERRHFPFVQDCCAVCGPQDGLLRCSRCHMVCYCGKDHQVQDFHAAHKKRCKMFKRPGDAL